MTVTLERNALVELASYLNELLDSTNDTAFTFHQIQTVWNRTRNTHSMVDTDLTHNCDDDTKYVDGVLRVLHTLALSFEKQRALTRSRINRCGIYSLPDEVISVIMGHAVTSYDEARNLSHVCSWFRAVTLATREIWANVYLSQDLHPEEIKLIIQRNNGTVLRARLQAEPQTPSIRRILRQAAHLEELYMALSDDLGDDERLDDLRLPALYKLTLRSWDKDGNPNFYCPWIMPRLEHLDLNFVPSMEPSSSLRLVKLSLHKYFYFDELLQFLGAFHLLTTLDISILQEPFDLSTNGGVLRLRSLKSLTIRDWSTRFALKYILNVLDVDALSEFTVMLVADPSCQQATNMEFVADVKLLRHINAVYAFANEHALLKKFSMHVEVLNNPLEDSPAYIFENLYLPLSGLPKDLETSVISSPFRTLVIYWETTGQQLEFRRARCIRVRGEGFTVDLFCDLGDSSLWKGTLPRRVEVDYNVPIEEEMVRAAFPESEIVYVS